MINRQRLKLLWNVWGYWPILTLWNISFIAKSHLMARLLRIDWNVEHCHIPFEIAQIFKYLSSRPARKDETMIEAGCWN
jgi:hypothetical protein